MSQPDEWMHHPDEAILEQLAAEQPDYPLVVAHRLGLPGSYAKRRCEVLEAHGLLEAVTPEVVYRVTEAGERAVLDDPSRRAGDEDESADARSTLPNAD